MNHKIVEFEAIRLDMPIGLPSLYGGYHPVMSEIKRLGTLRRQLLTAGGHCDPQNTAVIAKSQFYGSRLIVNDKHYALGAATRLHLGVAAGPSAVFQFGAIVGKLNKLN